MREVDAGGCLKEPPPSSPPHPRVAPPPEPVPGGFAMIVLTL
jgi:hypothetical protein